MSKLRTLTPALSQGVGVFEFETTNDTNEHESEQAQRRAPFVKIRAIRGQKTMTRKLERP